MKRTGKFIALITALTTVTSCGASDSDSGSMPSMGLEGQIESSSAAPAKSASDRAEDVLKAAGFVKVEASGFGHSIHVNPDPMPPGENGGPGGYKAWISDQDGCFEFIWFREDGSWVDASSGKINPTPPVVKGNPVDKLLEHCNVAGWVDNSTLPKP